jgi:hypothetical protein
MLKLGASFSGNMNAIMAVQFGLAYLARTSSPPSFRAIHHEARAEAGAIAKVLGTDQDDETESTIMDAFAPSGSVYRGTNVHAVLGRFLMETVGQGRVVCVVLIRDTTSSSQRDDRWNRALCLLGSEEDGYAVYDVRPGEMHTFGHNEMLLRRFMTAVQNCSFAAYFSDTAVVAPPAVEDSTEAAVPAAPKKVVRKRLAPTAVVPTADAKKAAVAPTAQQAASIEDE